MKNIFLFISMLVLVIFLSSCFSSGPQMEPGEVTFSREKLEDAPIELPAGFSSESYRKLTMGVAFSDLGKKAGDISPKIVQTVSARMQTEMAKLKRFTIFSAFNRGGVTMYQELSEDGEVDLKKPVDQKALDLVLTGAITVTKERQERYDHDEIIYEVECDFNCEDLKTRTVKFAEKTKGRTFRTQAFSLSGKKLGGYDEEDEKQAIYNAAMKALAVLANKLNNEFPVGGHVTAITRSAKRLTLDKGKEDGIAKDMQMVVFCDDGGVDIPLAFATAQPGKNDRSSLKIWRWNDSDEDAEPIIDDIKANPRKWLDNNEMNAVSVGAAVPPEWNKEYKDTLYGR